MNSMMDSPPPNENIVLIGRTRPQITSDKLPNNLQVLDSNEKAK